MIKEVVLFLLITIILININNVIFESLKYIGDSIGWIINIIILISIYWLTQRNTRENNFKIKKNSFINLLSEVDKIVEVEKLNTPTQNFLDEQRNFDYIKNNLNRRFNYNLVNTLKKIDNKDFYRFDNDLREIIREIRNQYGKLGSLTYDVISFFPNEITSMMKKSLKNISNMEEDKKEIIKNMYLKHDIEDSIDGYLAEKDYKKYFNKNQILVQYFLEGWEPYSTPVLKYNYMKKMNIPPQKVDLSETEIIYELYFYCDFKKEAINPLIKNIKKFFDIMDKQKKKYEIY
jgi:hypothetical protein